MEVGEAALLTLGIIVLMELIVLAVLTVIVIKMGRGR